MIRRPFAFLLGLVALGSLAFACDGEPDDFQEERRPLGGNRGFDDGSGGTGGATGGTGGATGGTGGTGGDDGLAGFGGVPVNCPDAQALCSEECVTLASDRAHCGDCDSPCGEGELCVSGECELACPVGMIACSNSCIDPSTDPEFCGATYCDDTGTDAVPCDTGEACTVGECRTFTPVWNGGVRIDTLDTDVGNGHALDMNPSGDAVVVWRQKTDQADETSYRIFSATYDAGTKAWSAPERLDDANTERVRGMDVAISANGDAVATWVEGVIGSGGPNRIMAAFFDAAAGTWGAATRVNALQGDPGVETDVESSWVVMDGSGDALVAWVQRAGSTTGTARVFRNVATAGVFGTPVMVPNQNGGRVSQLRVGSNEAGRTALVWIEASSAAASPTMPMVATGSVTGAWSAPVDVRVDANLIGLNIDAAVDEEGDVHLAYNAYSTADAPAQVGLVTRAQEDDVWGSEAFTKEADTSMWLRSARIAVTRAGEAVLAVERMPSTNTNMSVLVARQPTPGGSWTPLQAVSTVLASGSRPGPQVGIDETRNSFSSWAFGSDAQTSRYLTSFGNWAGAQAVNTGAISGSSAAELAVAPSGTALIAFEQLDDGKQHLFVARYD